MEPADPLDAEVVCEELKRLRTLWHVCLFSPLVYLLVARFVDVRWFSHPEWSGGALALGVTWREPLLALLALGATVAGAALVWLRRRALLPPGETNILHLLARFRKRMLTMWILCDLVAFLGFLLFAVSADLRLMLWGGLLGLSFYAWSFPGREVLRQMQKVL